MPHCTCVISNNGPFLTVYIGISLERRKVLQEANLPIPNIVPANMLIDTGASMTCVDSSIIQQLGINPIGTTPILTPSTGDSFHECYTYDISIGIPGGSDDNPIKLIHALPVVESNFSTQGHHGLIGRDILKHSRMIYSGIDNMVMLSIC